MDCFPDFCLGCDSQAVDGFYCSETCRMANIERSSCSNPPSPTDSCTLHSSDFNFAQSPHKPSTWTKPSGSTSQPGNIDKSTLSPQRVLSPSSSRSSLSSTGNGNDIVPEEAVKELLNYFNAFDRTRDHRRKSMALAQQSHSWDTNTREVSDS